MRRTGPVADILARHDAGMRDAVHRTIVVVDIAKSTDPIRRNADRIVIRDAMYRALSAAFAPLGGFGHGGWYHEDRGDGALVLAPPGVPKAQLVTDVPDRLEAALGRHNRECEERLSVRGSATRVRLRVAIHAGEVTFDRHGVVGHAIDHTFRLVDAPELKVAQATSRDNCTLIVSDWMYSNVVYHHKESKPNGYHRIDCTVKQTPLSAWLRTPLRQRSMSDSADDTAGLRC